MKKCEKQKELLEKYYNQLYVLMFAFGGACSQKQLLSLEDFSNDIIKELILYNILKSKVINKKVFIICRNSVYRFFGIEQNYRLSAYTLKKSCLLAEYWLSCHTKTETIIKTIQKGNLHQFNQTIYNNYISYLHSQGCYIRFLTDNPKTIYFVFFPKSNNPKTISIFIKNFFNGISAIDDNCIYKLSIRLNDIDKKNKILKYIDGRYWYILENIHFFELNCQETINII